MLSTSVKYLLISFFFIIIFNCLFYIDAKAQRRNRKAEQKKVVKKEKYDKNPFAKARSSKLVTKRVISYYDASPGSITDLAGNTYNAGISEKDGHAPFSGRVYYLTIIMNFKNDVSEKPYLFGEEYVDERFAIIDRVPSGTDTVTTFPQDLMLGKGPISFNTVTEMMRNYSDMLVSRYDPASYMVVGLRVTVETSKKYSSKYPVIEFAVKEVAKEKFGDYVRFEFKTITKSNKNLKEDLILIESKLINYTVNE
jgi:hypothetical protein